MNKRLKKTIAASILILLISILYVFGAIISGSFIAAALVFGGSASVALLIAWAIVALCN
tara:strand:+ start:364 stop:540 length:177 start_codon:yes stop_codon:yes gene_type:complete